MQDANLLKDIASTITQIYFFNQDLHPAFCYFDKEQATWIGLGGNMIVGYDEVIDFIGKYREKDPECELTDEKHHILAYGDEHALLIGEYTFDMLNAMGSIFYVRMTYCFVKREGQWKITHVHVSSPSYSDYLDKRIHQTQLAAQTINAGLRGALDDENYTILYVNDELCNMLGYTRDEYMEMSGGTVVGAVYPPDVDRCLREVEHSLSKGGDYRIEYRVRKKDGNLMWVMDYGKKVRDSAGNTQINSVVMDISELKNTVSQLEIEKERNEIVAELAEDIIFEYDPKEDRLEVFYPASMNKGIRERKVIAGCFKQNGWKELDIREEDKDRIVERIQNMNFENGHMETVKDEYRQKHQEGDTPWRRVLVRGIFDADKTLARVIGKIFDITSEKKLEMRSTTDSLTGAYNREYLRQEITRYLTEKDEELSYACILIDIDYFKEVNDKYGHMQGDLVLKKLVDMLKNMFRKTDVVARLGGDEFMVFIEDIYDIVIVEEKVRRLLDRAKGYYINEQEESGLGLSIGITISNRKDVSTTELYRQADIALYNAKEQGRGCYRIYTEDMKHPWAENQK